MAAAASVYMQQWTQATLAKYWREGAVRGIAAEPRYYIHQSPLCGTL
jgi:hypothetical protein